MIALPEPGSMYAIAGCTHTVIVAIIVKGIILLNEALVIAPDYLDAHRELGSYYREVKDFKKAFKHFSHIVKKHPKAGSTPVYIAGEMAYLSAEYDSALVYLERYMSKGNLIFSMKEKGKRYCICSN